MRHDVDAAGEHLFEQRRVEPGRAAPVPERPGVERHQVREPQRRRLEREADDRQRRAVAEQGPGRLLSGDCSRAFENGPTRIGRAGRLRKFGDPGAQLLARQGPRIEGKAHSHRGSRSEAPGVDVETHDRRAHVGRDLRGEGPDAPEADDDREAPRERPERWTAWKAVETASATTARCRSVNPLDAWSGASGSSPAPGTAHRNRPGSTTRVAKPPSRSLPGMICDRQIVSRPERHSAHSPHGSTAGTTTARPTSAAVSRPGVFDVAADLVAEDQGRRMPCANPIVEETDVGVADAAASDSDQHVVGRETRDVPRDRAQRRARLHHLPAGDRRHGPMPPWPARRRRRVPDP